MANLNSVFGSTDTPSPENPDIVDVSVLIAVRNGLPYITEQLSALGRQTYRGSWEVIVSDNGSTDGSVDALNLASKRLPICIVDSRTVKGKGAAVAIAAQKARGRLLLFCDQDDVVADDWVEQMTAALELHPAVGGRMDETSLNSARILAWRPVATPGGLQRPFGLLPAPIGANCGLRRSIYDEVGGCDPSFTGAGAAGDTDLFWRVQLAGYRLAYAPKAVVAYRHRPDLWSLLQQWRAYGRARAHLVARYQMLGLLSAESWRDVIATLTWVLVHTVDCVRGSVRRMRYLRTLAHLLGQLEGGREVGILHLSRDGPQPTAKYANWVSEGVGQGYTNS